MTLKQLEQKGFSIFKRNGKYILYKDVENWYNLQGYYGEIIKINDKTFQFKDYKATSKIDELLSQIQEYNSKLFRPVIYYDTVMRTGFPDVLLIRDELKKAGFKDAGGTWSDQRQDCWELKTNVFGSSFVFEVYIKHEWDSRYFDVCYSMSGHFFSPFYKVRCFGAESVLFMVNKMKTYVLEQTIKQLVELYAKQISTDHTQVSIESEGVIAIDGNFRLWIDNRTWDKITEQDGTKYDYNKMIPVAYFKKNQDLMVAVDLMQKQDNTGLVAL